MIYLIADLHLDHKNIIKYCNRPFNSVGEMNKVIIDNWNKKIRDNDTVYFLGDMSFGRDSREASYWLDKLNGNIIFIRGSHDKVRGIKSYDRLILKYRNKKFLLIHNPYFANGFKGFVIHGHVHNNDLENYPLINRKNKTINVSCELLNYKPIPINELEKVI